MKHARVIVICCFEVMGMHHPAFLMFSMQIFFFVRTEICFKIAEFKI